MTGKKVLRLEIRLTKKQLQAVDYVAAAWNISRTDVVLRALADNFRGSYIPGGFPFDKIDINSVFPF